MFLYLRGSDEVVCHLVPIIQPIFLDGMRGEVKLSPGNDTITSSSVAVVRIIVFLYIVAKLRKVESRTK